MSVAEFGSTLNLHAAFPTPGGVDSNKISADLTSAVITSLVVSPNRQVYEVARASKQCAVPKASRKGVVSGFESWSLMYAQIDKALK